MKAVALTGAGISKSAGIPTFDEYPELRGKLSVEFKLNHPKEFNEAKMLLVNNVKDKEPTKAHRILAQLQIPVITMNIDNLHRKAGSKKVIEIHGNYLSDNIVLYGQDMHDSEDALTLVIKTAREAQKNNEDAVLLIIGTSMQIAFAHVLVWAANQYGMKELYIDKDADTEVEQFFKRCNMI